MTPVNIIQMADDIREMAYDFLIGEIEHYPQYITNLFPLDMDQERKIEILDALFANLVFLRYTSKPFHYPKEFWDKFAELISFSCETHYGRLVKRLMDLEDDMYYYGIIFYPHFLKYVDPVKHVIIHHEFQHIRQFTVDNGQLRIKPFNGHDMRISDYDLSAEEFTNTFNRFGYSSQLEFNRKMIQNNLNATALNRIYDNIANFNPRWVLEDGEWVLRDRGHVVGYIYHSDKIRWKLTQPLAGSTIRTSGYSSTIENAKKRALGALRERHRYGSWAL